MLKVLPDELVSLIHHVELNKVNWWKQALQRLIVATIWQSEKQLSSAAAIRSELKRIIGIEIAESNLAAELQSLLESMELRRLPNGRIKLSDEQERKCHADLEGNREIERNVQDKFIRQVATVCSKEKAEHLWHSFNTEFLIPLTREFGAKTYDMLSGNHRPFAESVSFAAFLDRYPPELARIVRSAVLDVLDPADLNSKAYVMRYLNAYFFVQSAGLSKKSLARITEGLSTRRPSFNVFVDTNFLFSILRLHDNPSNEAALSLVELINNISEYVDLTLFISPITVEETQNVLYASQTSLERLALSQNLAIAAVETDAISGIKRKFASEKANNRYLTPETYFAPYFSGLVSILETKGVKLYDEDLAIYRTNGTIQREIAMQDEYQQRRFKETAKPYASIEHDVILWHSVKRKRPSVVESPVDAGFWIATIDFGFLRYDDKSRKGAPHEVPICLHPTTLIQMLQFWIPRTDDYDTAILNSLRFPFLFLPFSQDYETASIRILGTLSRLEGAEDIPTEIAARLLVSQSLRKVIQGARNQEEQTTQVRDAILEDIAEQMARLAEAERDISDLQSNKEALEAEQSRARLTINTLSTELDELRARDEENKLIESTRQLRIEFSVKWSLILLGVLSVSVLICIAAGSIVASVSVQGVSTEVVQLGFKRFCFIVVLVTLGLYILVLDRSGMGTEAIRDWKPFRRLHEARKWLFGILLAGIVVNASWDVIKHELQLFQNQN
jgi:hypothetical protein